ncbi:MFS transporter [Nocardia sp. NPDC052566]|uniref:MFS transporter n=1 Tax=Nocardia sp. NPDC052566 TaxID=3364330 RepID=UPI0037C509AB
MTPQPPPAGSEQRKLRQLMAAALVGSSIEAYDFLIYGTAAALVFGEVFFPNSSSLMGTLLSFSTFWVGFLARPLGGLIFGHVGDTFGRKPALVACLALIAVATCAIGLLPTAATIGVAAPILLLVLRFLQGLAAGGHWGGVTLLLTETTRPDRKGRAGTFSQLGTPFGLLLGTGAFLLVGGLVRGQDFLAWGWRIPFLASALLIPVVLFIQLRIEDSPEFRRLQKRAADPATARAKAPILEVVRKHPRRVLLGAGLLCGGNATFYTSVAAVLDYGVRELGLTRNELLMVSLAVSAAAIPVIHIAGSLSDRYGRRPIMLAGAVIMTVWAFPYFWLVDTGSIVSILIAGLVGTSLGAAMVFGPLAAYLTELFEPRIRYSGITLAYQLASIVVSGGTPFLMTALPAATGGTAALSGFLMLMAVCTLGCAWALPETVPRRLAAAEDAAAVPVQL